MKHKYSSSHSTCFVCCCFFSSSFSSIVRFDFIHYLYCLPLRGDKIRVLLDMAHLYLFQGTYARCEQIAWIFCLIQATAEFAITYRLIIERVATRLPATRFWTNFSIINKVGATCIADFLTLESGFAIWTDCCWRFGSTCCGGCFF